ncbi:hypothetical protein [Caldimicrobium thiodismutans]|nr:hypothetical protein [Caldimicrobium thiodismutans]
MPTWLLFRELPGGNFTKIFFNSTYVPELILILPVYTENLSYYPDRLKI